VVFINSDVQCNASRAPGGHHVHCYVKLALCPRNGDMCLSQSPW
jgi:hypothetical protein